VDSGSEYIRTREAYGIKWEKSPAFTIVTPKGNYFPIPMQVNLGDEATIDKVLT